MPTVTVIDLVVPTSKVKLPAICLGCGGRLRQERALRGRVLASGTYTITPK
jgi:hypothetical protein